MSDELQIQLDLQARLARALREAAQDEAKRAREELLEMLPLLREVIADYLQRRDG